MCTIVIKRTGPSLQRFRCIDSSLFHPDNNQITVIAKKAMDMRDIRHGALKKTTRRSGTR